MIHNYNLARFLRHIWPYFSLAALCAALLMPSSAGAAAAIPPQMPTNAEIFQTLEELVSHGPRRQGSEGGDFAVQYVADKMREYGLSDVHVESVTTSAWDAQSSGLKIGSTDTDAFPVAFSLDQGPENTGTFSTPPGGTSGRIVDVGSGSDSSYDGKDVRGKIVMFDLKFQLPLAAMLPVTEFFWDPQLTLLNTKTLFNANPYITNYRAAAKAAIDHGAVGFVGVLSDYFDSNKYYNEFYRATKVSIPGMWVTKRVGADIRSKLKANPALEASVSLSTTRRRVPANTVVGYLEGASKDSILVTSHHDSVWEGAVEDGTGTVEVLALAKYYSQLPASSRKKTLMFSTNDTHFTGYAAHNAFIRRHVVQRNPATEPHRIVANVGIEHIGKAASVGKNGELVVSNAVEPRGIFENLNPMLGLAIVNAVVRNDLRRTAILNANPLQATGIPTDVSGLLMAGVPTVSLISGPVYMYDEADTLDKVPVDQLRPVANTFANIIDAIDNANSETIGYLPLAITTAIGKLLLKDAPLPE
jgi:hypothetical protein